MGSKKARITIISFYQVWGFFTFSADLAYCVMLGHPIDPATQPIILKIVGFMESQTVDQATIEKTNFSPKGHSK